MKVLALIAFVASVASAETTAPVGALDERGLMFHEAWAEARLSMDHARLEHEWSRLVNYLKSSMRGKARVNVIGGAEDWVIELKPLSGPMMVRVDPSGGRVMAPDRSGTMEPRTLLPVYPWRRHYDCEGRALNPSRPGLAIRGKPCTVPAGMEWRMVAAPASEDGAIVQAVQGLPNCFRVVSESGGVLRSGQVLMEQKGKRYAMEQMPDDKLRLRYRENTHLFAMFEKQPIGVVIGYGRDLRVRQ